METKQQYAAAVVAACKAYNKKHHTTLTPEQYLERVRASIAV